MEGLDLLFRRRPIWLAILLAGSCRPGLLRFGPWYSRGDDPRGIVGADQRTGDIVNEPWSRLIRRGVI